MTPEQEENALAHDMFAGDFGTPDDHVFRNAMVTARKAGPCHCCREEIQPKSRIRSQTEKYDGEIMTFRWCTLCCEAMARSGADNGDSLQKRFDMGMGKQDGI